MNLCNFYNENFIEELLELSGRNTFLLLVDGSLVFGRVDRVNDGFVRVLAPSNIARLKQALFRPPAVMTPAPDVLAKEITVSGCDIAQAVEGPFVTSPVAIGPNPIIEETLRPSIDGPEGADCGEVRALVERLEKLERRDLGVETQGGWLTGGQLRDVDDCTAWLEAGFAASPPLIVPGTLTVFGGELPPAGLVLTGPFRNIFFRRKIRQKSWQRNFHHEIACR